MSDRDKPTAKPGDLLEPWIGKPLYVRCLAGVRVAGVLEAFDAETLLLRGLEFGDLYVVARKSLVAFYQLPPGAYTKADVDYSFRKQAWS